MKKAFQHAYETERHEDMINKRWYEVALEYEIDHVRDKEQRFKFSLQVIHEITKHMIKK